MVCEMSRLCKIRAFTSKFGTYCKSQTCKFKFEYRPLVSSDQGMISAVSAASRIPTLLGRSALAFTLISDNVLSIRLWKGSH